MGDLRCAPLVSGGRVDRTPPVGRCFGDQSAIADNLRVAHAGPCSGGRGRRRGTLQTTFELPERPQYGTVTPIHNREPVHAVPIEPRCYRLPRPLRRGACNGCHYGHDGEGCPRCSDYHHNRRPSERHHPAADPAPRAAPRSQPELSSPPLLPPRMRPQQTNADVHARRPARSSGVFHPAPA